MKHIVIACIVHHQKICVARRLTEPYAGKIELPGGKCEAGESLYQALARELKEEVDAALESACYLFQHPLKNQNICLHFYQVKLKNQPSAMIYESLIWVDLDKLEHLDWIEHNKPLIPKIQKLVMAKPKELYIGCAQTETLEEYLINNEIPRMQLHVDCSDDPGLTKFYALNLP